MSWYEKEKLLLPSLHKCHYCGKRFKKREVVAEWSFSLDQGDVDYYCDEECAKAEREIREKRLTANIELNSRIKGCQ